MTVPRSGLTALQRRVLTTLAGFRPPWTLTGGAAIVGFHGVRRTTRDLGLFFHGLERLAGVSYDVSRTLTASGFAVVSLQTGEAFRRLRVSDGGEVVLLDLVAEPVPPVEQPAAHDLEGSRVLVDTPHEILVNKLCALVSRSELRDLSDVSDLLAAGGDLRQALVDAPRKEAGFSPLTLAWSLRQLPIASMADVAGLDAESHERLSKARDDLVARVTAASRPGS
jgi:hypothetical protein